METFDIKEFIRSVFFMIVVFAFAYFLLCCGSVLAADQQIYSAGQTSAPLCVGPCYEGQ